MKPCKQHAHRIPTQSPLLCRPQIPLPDLQRHRPWTQIKRLPPVLLPPLMRKRKLVPMQHTGQKHRLLQVADIPTNTASRSGTERDEICLQLLGSITKPPLWAIDFGLRKDIFVTVRHVGRYRYGGVAGDEGVEDGGAFGWRATREAEG